MISNIDHKLASNTMHYPPKTESLFRMKYAFAYHIVHQVLGESPQLSPEEQAFIDEQFPTELLKVLNIDDPDERQSLFDRASTELPQRMTVEERLELVGMFFAASSLNGEMLFQEFSILTVAAEFLEVPLDLMTSYIDQLLSDRTMPEIDMEAIFQEAYTETGDDQSTSNITSSLPNVAPMGRFPPGYKPS